MASVTHAADYASLIRPTGSGKRPRKPSQAPSAPSIRLFSLPEYKKAIPLIKFSSTEDKKAVPMKQISFPKELFRLPEEHFGIPERPFFYSGRKIFHSRMAFVSSGKAFRHTGRLIFLSGDKESRPQAAFWVGGG